MPCGSRSDVAGAPAPVLDERQQKAMEELEKVAEFMDTNLFELCGYGIGADAIVGLVPGIGDGITTIVSLYMMGKIGYFFPEVLKSKWPVMSMNIAIDFGTGLVPVLGDIIDAGWHSNIKNVNILRKHYGLPLLSEVMPEDKDKSATRDVASGDAVTSAKP